MRISSIRLSLLLVTALALAGACDDDDAGTADAAPQSDGTAGDATTGADAPETDALEADASETGGPCGGFAGLQCEAGFWCDYPGNRCGGDDVQGICRPLSRVCPDVVDPVCGCDGEVYGNACEASAAGTDIAAAGGCEPPEGTFACGARFCNEGAEYCEHVGSDIAEEPDTFTCRVSEMCDDAPNCTCLAGERCGDMCTTDANGNPTVTCFGG